MDLESSETAARGMPGGEPTSGMAEPNHEEISSSSSSSTNHIWEALICWISFPYIRVVMRLLKPDFSLRSMSNSILPRGAEKTAGMRWVGLEKF